MKRLISLITMALLMATSAARADDATVEAAIAVDENTKPTDTFTEDTPKLYAFFRSDGTKKGDVFRGVWIADDVGKASPANTKVDESSLTADSENYYGAFSLSKPTAGWPVGKYHIDIYLGSTVATTAPFTITAADAEAKPEGDAKPDADATKDDNSTKIHDPNETQTKVSQ